jgi:hypothetical protein
MELIDRYVHEVSALLPRGLRQDVATELRSTLEETLEGRREQNPTESSEDAVVAILRDFGPPSELAASYHPEATYLVGPSLYPAFRTTIRVCFFILIGLVLLGLFTGLGEGPLPVKRLVLGLVASFDSFLNALLTLIGLVVVVFAVVERASGQSGGSGVDWDPRTLPSKDDPNRVNRVAMAIQLAALTLLFYVANFESHRLISSFLMDGDESGWVPILGPGFRASLNWLNLVLVLDITLGIWVLRKGRWQSLTRWLDLGTTLLLAYYLFRLALGPTLVVVDPQWMIQNGWSAEAAARHVKLTNETISPALAVALKFGFLGTCIGAVVQLKNLVTGKH